MAVEVAVSCCKSYETFTCDTWDAEVTVMSDVDVCKKSKVVESSVDVPTGAAPVVEGGDAEMCSVVSVVDVECAAKGEECVSDISTS